MPDAILTIPELADEWMTGNREIVRYQLYRSMDVQHALHLFASIVDQLCERYGEECATQFCKSFAPH